MPGLLQGKRLVIATHNAGKLREFQALLTPYVASIVSSGELNLPEPVETGSTFAANAILKAASAAKATNSVALADDSGLCVTALNNQPGIYSARYAGPDKNFADAMQRLHNELGDAKDRSAHFVCVLALTWPDGQSEIFEGRVDGTLVWPPRGAHGHGYDPFFLPDGYTETFGEMPADDKNAISHRAVAVQKLIARLEKGEKREKENKISSFL